MLLFPHKHPQNHTDYLSNWLGILGPSTFINKSWIERIAKCFQGYSVSTLELGEKDVDHEIYPPFQIRFTENIQSHNIACMGELSQFKLRNMSKNIDLLLIDALSFVTEKQIVIIDDSHKKAFKYLKKLKTPLIFILSNGLKKLPEELNYLKEKFDHVPIVKSEELDSVVKLIEGTLLKPEIKFKTLIVGHEHFDDIEAFDKAINTYDIVKHFCDDIYFIPKNNLTTKYESFAPCLKRRFLDMNLLGELLSAFSEDKNSAWLILSSNLQELNEYTLRLLLSQRDKSKNASAFYSATLEQFLPDFCIWEPKSFSLLLDSIYFNQCDLAPLLELFGNVKRVDLPEMGELDDPYFL